MCARSTTRKSRDLHALGSREVIERGDGGDKAGDRGGGGGGGE